MGRELWMGRLIYNIEIFMDGKGIIDGQADL
jgi:hypothetical protein